MDPVLVVIIAPLNECVFCEALMKIWPKVTESLLSIYPKLKFPEHTNDTKNYKYPPIIMKNKQLDSKHPKDLINYCGQFWSWTPMTLLVSGESWKNALNGGKLENVQIMNSKLVNNILKPFPTWNTKNPTQFGLWLKDTLPKVQNQIQLYPSILEPIVKKNEPVWNIVTR